MGKYNNDKVFALIDSGATRNFISKQHVEALNIPIVKKPYLQIVQTIEGNDF
jgi:predicted aspartyl protease